jgi:hypothetical protein
MAAVAFDALKGVFRLIYWLLAVVIASTVNPALGSLLTS